MYTDKSICKFIIHSSTTVCKALQRHLNYDIIISGGNIMHYDVFGGMYYLHTALIDTLSKNGELKPEVVFHGILAEKDREDEYIRQLTAFAQTCKKLCDHGFYDAVLKFMHSVFMYRSEYDIAAIGEKLCEIDIRDGYTLADLCSDYYIEVLSQHFAIIDGDEETEKRTRALRLYDPEEELPVYRNCFSAQHYEIAFELISEKVWGVKATCDDVTKATIDGIVSAARSVTTEKHKALSGFQAKLRAETIELEKKHGSPSLVGKPVVSSLTVEYRDSILPGALLLPFILCEKYNMSEECFYMLDEYILPYLCSLSWNESDKETQTFALILHGYLPHFEFLINRMDSPLYYANHLNLTASKLFGRISDPAPKEFVSYCTAHKSTFAMGAALLHKSEKALLKVSGSELYGRQIISLAYLLDIAGESDKATDILIRHYKDLHDSKDNRHLAVTVLIRCILSTESLAAANTLYGYFTSEEALYERDRRNMVELIAENIDLLKAAKEYIRENDQQDTLTDKSIYELLYSDDRIDGVAEALLRCEMEDCVPDRSITGKLNLILEAFSLSKGINLGKLGYDRHDTFDQYISGGLSEPIRLKAADIYKRNEQFASFRVVESIENFRRSADLTVQNHIVTLQRTAILEHLAKIDELRQQSNDDEFMSETIIRLTESLAEMLRPEGYDRIKTERLVRQSHTDFCNRFYSDIDGYSILDNLPHEIRNEIFNYFVTSEMIFRYLDDQGDESLDFTPALISLTKALEYVLFCAYEKLDISDTEDVDNSILGHNFERTANGVYHKLPHLELGNLIYLLKDGKQIYLDKQNSSVYYPTDKLYAASHFKKWNNGIFNIGALKRFAPLDITVSDYPDKDRAYTVHFVTAGPDADDINRATLAKALEYIKETYRNPAAHKDRMPKSTVAACRELMLSSEQLLWILLSITDLSEN